MFTEPLSGWRAVNVRPQRKKIDWALEIEELLRIKYAKAEKIILVCDNLNIHYVGHFMRHFQQKKLDKLLTALNFVIHQSMEVG